MVNFPTLLCFAILATATSREVVPNEGGCISIAQADCCKYKDGRPGYNNGNCVPALADKKFHTGQTCEPECVVNGQICSDSVNGGKAYPDETGLMDTCATTTPSPTTTTVTPWDSSASSSADSDSLNSVYSSSFEEQLFTSSESSDDSFTESSGSAASGSSGSYMFHWQWLLLLCCCCAAVVAPLLKPKPKKKPVKKGPAKTTLASDHPAGCTYLEVASQTGFKAGQVIEIGKDAAKELAEVTGLGSILLAAPIANAYPAGTPVVEVKDGRKPSPPALIPTTTAVIPSYQMAAPVTTSYAAPVAYAAPATTAYAAPATAAYATAAYAPVGTTSYAVSGGNVV